MPGAAVGVPVRIGHVRQHAVHLLAVPGRCRPVDRGPHQRVPEADAAAELDEPRSRSRGPWVGAEPEPPGRGPQQSRVPERLGGGDEQQAPGVRRKRLQLADETLFDAAGQKPAVRRAVTSPAALRYPA